MARSNRRRPSKAVDWLLVGPSSALPPAIVEYFLALPPLKTFDLPVHDIAKPDVRSAKRRRVEPFPSSAISIAKDLIIISRPSGDKNSLSCIERRENAGFHLDLFIHNDQLSIVSRPSSPLGPLRSRICLQPDEISQQGRTIIEVAGYESKSTSVGGIWTNIDVEVELRDGIALVKLFLELFWNETPSPYSSLRPKRNRKCTQKLIAAFFPPIATPGEGTARAPMDFYEAAHVPSREDSVPLSIKIPGLTATLFPYQKRTLQWLLAREGTRWDQSSSVLRPLSKSQEVTPTIEAFRTVKDAYDNSVYVNDVFQVITRDTSAYGYADRAVKGGILAEEMGLGKTLEILGLVLLHSRTKTTTPKLSDDGSKLTPSGATLIVTPESLRTQWLSEIARHAPGLRVKHYQGCKTLSDTEQDIVTDLAAYDVVITTYSVLSAEVHFTTEPPDRSRRYARAHPRPISPLVQISWWRLCLDEAQMIENSFSQAATVARVISRVNAWGITGTPVKDHVQDLFGLLLFLRYHPYCGAPQIWQALLTQHKPLFQEVFKAISLRHTKSLVRDELSLPPQKRFVISMPFTAVEEQHYQSLYKQMAEECKLDADGTPTVDDWRTEDHEDAMNIWLTRLRQATLHPEVGQYNRRILGHSKTRPMRTVDEVLTAMLEQSENAVRNDERAYLSSRLTRGQLYENSPRVKEALAIWEEVRTETEKLVVEARKRLALVIKEDSGDEPSPQTRDVDDDDDDSDGILESESESEEVESKGRAGDCQRRLRAALEMHHKALFFCANAYFQIKESTEMTEPESEEFAKLKKLEIDGYEEAKVVRREILRESYRKASRLMGRISRKAAEGAFAEVPELVVSRIKGIESGRIVDSLEILYGELNEQANVLDEWREHLVQLLLRPLVDEDDGMETTGEELGDSAKIQDELMVYVQALRAAISDRQGAITGQVNELVRHETETSMRMAKSGEGPAPEKLMELLQVRATIKPKLAQTSMRGAISEFRVLQTKFNRDKTAAESTREILESRIASDLLKSTQAALNAQNKAALALESEIEGFKTAMNRRLEYYRQLQSVSDAVLPYDGPRSDETAAKLKRTEDDTKRRLSSAEAKHRYLLNLKEAGSKSNDPRMCVICQAPFLIGVLTVCGHEFCKECMTMWFKAHHNCPVCKKALKPSNLHDITLTRKQLQIHREGPGQAADGEDEDEDEGFQNSLQKRNIISKKGSIYTEFNATKLTEIMDMELDGPSFTTKVDVLVRHLLWLRESDPGAKSIVFSQYKDFLNILRTAFQRFRIGYASIDDAGGITKFKGDPATECFLLHARAHSSGLNLVNASHVFLCEPLLNTALELQAIARVDRIGQEHETTVWLYLVSGTVEESIHNLSVRRRMEHMGKNLKAKSRGSSPDLVDANIEAANTLEMEQAALSKLMSRDKTAGETVDKGDLWECLFGHDNTAVAGADWDPRLQEKAVIGYMAGTAAQARQQ